MQSFKITATPLLHRINLKTNIVSEGMKPRKENAPPPVDNYSVEVPPARRKMHGRSFNLASGSLHQRAYHHEPYPVTSNHSGSVSPSPTELCLPPFSSPSSPKLKQPLLHTPLPTLADSPSFWLAMYFCFNLGLTLYNKGVLVRFPFPYTLSALHALFGTIGGTLLAHNGYFVPSRPSLRESVVLVAFSILYAINIVVSNVSLQLVTVPVSLLIVCHVNRLTSSAVPPSRTRCNTPFHYSILRCPLRCSKQPWQKDIAHTSGCRRRIRVSRSSVLLPTLIRISAHLETIISAARDSSSHYLAPS